MAHSLILGATITILLTLAAGTLTDAVINSKIDRTIDLSSQLVKIIEKIHVEENPETYKITIDPSHKDRLAYIDVTLNGKALSIIEDSPDGTYAVNLAGQNLKQPIVITTVYTKLLEPYPAEIAQNERQLVRYHGKQTTLSPYLTKTITTKIKLPQSSRLESFTRASKMTTGSNKLTYGPFTDVKPNQADSLTIHYENNTPFVAIKHLARSVEVSPWSQSINIVNEVKVVHTGAKLKGSFSRFEYQRDHHTNGLSVVRNFVVELPRSSRDIFYRDGIGNISTSNVRTTSTKTMLGLKPRFPLFGGWVTDFNLGYRVPISDFLNEPKSGQNFRLSLPFADLMYENMFIEEATVKIYLPSGATNVEVTGPVKFERLVDDLTYSYLDVIGRPVVVLKKKNIVPQHVDNKHIVIRYNYSKMYMLQEPILLLVATLGTFLLIVICSRMSKSQPSQSVKSKSD